MGFNKRCVQKGIDQVGLRKKTLMRGEKRSLAEAALPSPTPKVPALEAAKVEVEDKKEVARPSILKVDETFEEFTAKADAYANKYYEVLLVEWKKKLLKEMLDLKNKKKNYLETVIERKLAQAKQ